MNDINRFIGSTFVKEYADRMDLLSLRTHLHVIKSSRVVSILFSLRT